MEDTICGSSPHRYYILRKAGIVPKHIHYHSNIGTANSLARPRYPVYPVISIPVRIVAVIIDLHRLSVAYLVVYFSKSHFSANMSFWTLRATECVEIFCLDGSKKEDIINK